MVTPYVFSQNVSEKCVLHALTHGLDCLIMSRLPINPLFCIISYVLTIRCQVLSFQVRSTVVIHPDKKALVGYLKCASMHLRMALKAQMNWWLIKYLLLHNVSGVAHPLRKFEPFSGLQKYLSIPTKE